MKKILLALAAAMLLSGCGLTGIKASGKQNTDGSKEGCIEIILRDANGERKALACESPDGE